MWRHAPFCEFLTQVCAHEQVHDVIIINNCASHTPDHVILTHEKIHMLDFGQNMFVNPSWNVGVYHAQMDLICIQNDDLEFDCDVFTQVNEFMQPHMGLISLSGEPATHDSIEFHKWQGESMFGCGQLMFFNRHTYCEIDPELLVYCGDNWLFDHMQHVTQANYLIRNLRHHTPYAQTSHAFRHMLHSEQIIYHAVCDRYHVHKLHV
jgi:hypothetical protein